MIRQNKIIAVIVGAAIALSGTAFAQSKAAKAPAAKSEKTATSMTRGVIKSMDANQIVIERKVKSGSKDKTKEMTLVMNSDTQKQGDLKVGSPVTVHYRFENKKDIATEVRAAAAKKATAKVGKGK